MRRTRITSIALGLALVLLALFAVLIGCAEEETSQPVVVGAPDSSDEPSSGMPPSQIGSDSAAVSLADVTLRLELLAEGFDQPVQVLTDGVNENRLYIVEKSGHVRILEDGSLLETPFLDVAPAISDGGEQGLLSIAFSPAFERTGAVYVNYTDRSGDTVITRYRVSVHDTSRVNARSREELLRIEQPFSNHNGGLLLFGPDGMLWVGTGDGGSAGDPLENASNPGSLLGKMLRLDVERELADTAEPPYGIPEDNPFIGVPGYAPEVWGLGLRNPWRYSFDRETGDLWIGDVGQNEWEEIDLVLADELASGADFGWDRVEGTHPYPADADPGDTSDVTLPVVEYDHTVGQSVTGGYVYRGERYPAFSGVYVYADFYGSIWGLRLDASAPENVLLWSGEALLSSFGEDMSGELLVCDLNGSIYRLAFDTP